MTEPRARDEQGQATVIIVGFAVLLLLLIAMVIDASAAFRHRQTLTNLADGAALSGADAGATGRDVYTGGIGEQPLAVTAAAARTGVHEYLTRTGAFRDHPGLTYTVRVTGTEVVVAISAPLELPLTFPGAPDTARVSATSAAFIDPE